MKINNSDSVKFFRSFRILVAKYFTFHNVENIQKPRQLSCFDLNQILTKQKEVSSKLATNILFHTLCYFLLHLDRLFTVHNNQVTLRDQTKRLKCATLHKKHNNNNNNNDKKERIKTS